MAENAGKKAVAQERYLGQLYPIDDYKVYADIVTRMV